MTVETTSQLSAVPEAPPIAEGEQHTAPQVEVTPESGVQTEQQPAKPEANPVQKRIDQLTWKAHEAERRYNDALMGRQEAEKVARELWQQNQEIQRRVTTPTLDQFTTTDEFQKAVREHNERYVQQQQQAWQEAMARQQNEQAQFAFRQQLDARIAEGRQKYTDYEEVVGNPSLPRLQSVNPALLNAILTHEQMPELSYYLGKNPAEAHRIAAMPPARAILEVGRIAADIARAPARQTSQAPAPPPTVGGSKATVGTDLYDSNTSFEAYVKARKAARARK